MDFIYAVFDAFSFVFDFMISQDTFIALLAFTVPLGALSLFHLIVFKEY